MKSSKYIASTVATTTTLTALLAFCSCLVAVGCRGELDGGGEPLDEEGLRTSLAVEDAHHAVGSVAFGEVTVDHRWKRVTYKRTFKDPIVVAKPFSANGGHPGVIRIRNVDTNGFEIRVQEWSYLDDWHYPERVGYVAAERGLQQLGDGAAGKSSIQLLAGSFKTDKTTFSRVVFANTLSAKPIVLASVATYMGAHPVVGRLQNIDAKGFDYRLQEEEAFEQTHTTETIHYVALTPGSAQLSDFRVVASEAASVDHNFKGISFDFTSGPVFVADLQTTVGTDTVNLRWRAKTAKGVQVRLTEERSLDDETDHWPETVGYLAIGRITATTPPPGLPSIKWRLSLPTGTKDPAGNVLGGTEIRSLSVFDGKLFAGNGYWMDTQGNPGPQVLVLDRPTSEGGKWRQDVRLDKSNLLISTMKSVTLTTDADGVKLATPERLLIAAGGWISKTITAHIRRVSGTWTKTTIEPVGSCYTYARSLGSHKDKVTGVDMVFAGSGGYCGARIYSGVYDKSEPSRVRWLGGPEKWEQVPSQGNRVTSFAAMNGELYATVCGKIYKRIDGPDPSWRLMYTHAEDNCPPKPGEIGYRGLTKLPDGSGKMIAALENRGIVTRFSVTQGGGLNATTELNGRTFLRNAWGNSSVGYAIVGYDGMSPIALPGTTKRVVLMGLEARVSDRKTWHGWERGGWFLARFDDGTYELSEIVDPTISPTPPLVATRSLVASPFASEKGKVIYAGGFDANHVSGAAHDTAWIYRGEFQ